MDHNNLSTVKIISLPAANPFAAANNGEFPSGSRNTVGDAQSRSPLQRPQFALPAVGLR